MSNEDGLGDWCVVETRYGGAFGDGSRTTAARNRSHADKIFRSRCDSIEEEAGSDYVVEMLHGDDCIAWSSFVYDRQLWTESENYDD